MNEEAAKIFNEAQKTKKFPKCPFCKERDGFILIGECFVCGVCISKAREKQVQENENRIITEVKRQILEELKRE